MELISPVPERDNQVAQQARTNFLELAADLKLSVSAQPKQRHTGWIYFLLRKEPKKMSILMTIVIVLSAVFGGAGLTVYAAQDSTPDSALYGLKLASEDARLGVTVEQHSRLELQLEFALRRMQEMAAQVNAGQDIPETLQNRWQNHLQTALQICTQLSDAQLEPALLLVREQLRLQEQIAANVSGTGLGMQTMEQVRAELKLRLQQVESGLLDPEQFRQQLRQGQEAQPVNPTGGSNPWTTGTPTPGSGYGPGPGECDTCTPQSNQGSQAKPGSSGETQNPWTTGTPTPYSGYGPGPGDCETCTPVGPQGPQNGGSQPNQTQQPGSGSGTGSGSGDPGSGGTPGDGSGGGSPDDGGGSGGGSPDDGGGSGGGSPDTGGGSKP
jgi:uncharacterized membrane protein YgcG